MDTYIIRTLMQGSNEFLFKCILLIYEHQSGTEQDSMTTHEENGQGFNKSDARIMSNYAYWIKKDTPLCKASPLSLSEIIDARQRMKKYTQQLTNYLTEEDLLL